MSRPATVTRQGIHIESDEPVSVYVLNNANTSADGFLAIPLEALGKKYIHCGYYDHSEFSPGWGGQAGIVATEDNTVVRISLRGVGDAHPSSFLHGTQTRIGEQFTVRLNRGETYLLRGSGLTRGIFDFTGTEIQATKPIGVVSGHQRTGIPSFSQPAGNRDYLAEMLPPSKHGEKYIIRQV